MSKKYNRIRLLAVLTLMPLFIFVLYELAWWYFQEDATKSYDLVERDFPSVFVILLVVFILPSFAVVCGARLAAGKGHRIAGIMILAITILLVIFSVLFRPL